MPRVEGCWANVLDNCDGNLTDEHIISVAVFPPEPGRANNRRGRLPRRVNVQRGGILPQGWTTVRNLTAEILCDFHNNTTSTVDEAGGQFARALEGLFRVDQERDNPHFRWAPEVFAVDGPLVERWFLKTVINHAVGQALPIGSPNAEPSRPTRELVEMVYGMRPIANPMGLFLLARVGQEFDFGENFQAIFMDRNGTHLSAGILVFRTLVFGFNFEPIPIATPMFERFAPLRGMQVLQRVNEMNFARTNVALRFDWPV